MRFTAKKEYAEIGITILNVYIFKKIWTAILNLNF